MKQLLKLTFASLCIVFLAIECKQNSGGSVIQKTDTTLCVGIYKNLLDSTIRFGEMHRVVKDSFDYVNIDSATRRKKLFRDTTYIIVISTEIKDSAMSKLWKLPVLDSLGHKNYIPLYYIYDKKYVRDGWGNADSAIAELKKVN